MFWFQNMRWHTGALFAFVVFTSSAMAAPAGGVINVQAENDLFAGAGDRHFTNGVRLSWFTPPETHPERLINTAAKLPFFEPGTRLRFAFGMGQNMFTPEDISRRDPDPADRPYAGWLYGSIGMTSESAGCLPGNSGRCLLESLELDLGMVGPASLARQTQRKWHGLINVEKPEGWRHQIKNEPGAVLFYERKLRARVRDLTDGLQYDFTPHIGGALGNVYTYGAAGATVRLGDGLPRDYGPPRIRPSLPGSGFFEPNGGLAWYLFAGFEARAVARNIFLDGNSFTDSRSVDRKPLTGDLQGGLVFTAGRVRLSVTEVLRSEEFKGQDKPDIFGAISLSYAY
ncbi:MAG TPA: lipid A deacylase LpxR family protein [Alphaproteobacteria bacterium]|nr:lipid A deacylase LpxR family protein [Alphaproteobacteria bacterium]